MSRKPIFLVATTAALACAACNGAGGQKRVDMREAKAIFDTRCTPCHGANGKGDGAGAAALKPKPRDYTDPAWQKSITDDQLRQTILKGGPAVGKSVLMPPNPDLESKPEVVNGLVKIVRDFGSK
jgi:mono/diheme cytochrome c family protein